MKIQSAELKKQGPVNSPSRGSIKIGSEQQSKSRSSSREQHGDANGTERKTHINDILAKQTNDLQHTYTGIVGVVRDVNSKTAEQAVKEREKRRIYKCSMRVYEHRTEVRIKQMSRAYSMSIPQPFSQKQLDPLWLRLMRKDTSDHMHLVHDILQSLNSGIMVTSVSDLENHCPPKRLARTTKLATWRALYYKDIVEGTLEPELASILLPDVRSASSYQAFLRHLAYLTGSKRRKLLEQQEALRCDLNLRFNGTKKLVHTNRFSIRCWNLPHTYQNNAKPTVGSVVKVIEAMDTWLHVVQVEPKSVMRSLRTVHMLRLNYQNTSHDFHETLETISSKYSHMLTWHRIPSPICRGSSHSLRKYSHHKVHLHHRITVAGSAHNALRLAKYILCNREVKQLIIDDKKAEEKRLKEMEVALREAAKAEEKRKAERIKGILGMYSKLLKKQRAKVPPKTEKTQQTRTRGSEKAKSGKQSRSRKKRKSRRNKINSDLPNTDREIASKHTTAIDDDGAYSSENGDSDYSDSDSSDDESNGDDNDDDDEDRENDEQDFGKKGHSAANDDDDEVNTANNNSSEEASQEDLEVADITDTSEYTEPSNQDIQPTMLKQKSSRKIQVDAKYKNSQKSLDGIPPARDAPAPACASPVNVTRLNLATSASPFSDAGSDQESPRQKSSRSCCSLL